LKKIKANQNKIETDRFSELSFEGIFSPVHKKAPSQIMKKFDLITYNAQLLKKEFKGGREPKFLLKRHS